MYIDLRFPEIVKGVVTVFQAGFACSTLCRSFWPFLFENFSCQFRSCKDHNSHNLLKVWVAGNSFTLYSRMKRINPPSRGANSLDETSFLLSDDSSCQIAHESEMVTNDSDLDFQVNESPPWPTTLLLAIQVSQ